MAIFFTPDTNILVRSWTQGRPGCEMDHWRTIRSKCEAGDLTLLVTEIVLLEAESQWQDLLDEIDTKLLAVKKALQDLLSSKPHDWSEIKDVGQALADQVERARVEKKDNAKKNHDEIDAILRAPFAQRLPFTSEIHFRARRRLLAGKFTKSRDRNSEADCAIIESLCEHFESEKGEHSLLLCSENHTDFGTEVNRRFYLHPILKEGLPPTELFLNLKSAIDHLNEPVEHDKVSATTVAAAAERDRTKKIVNKASELIIRAPGKQYSMSACEIQILVRLHDRMHPAKAYVYDHNLRQEILGRGFLEQDYRKAISQLVNQHFVFAEKIEIKGGKVTAYKISGFGSDWLFRNSNRFGP